MYTPLQQALENPNEVTALEVTKEDIKAGIPADVQKLSRVHSLSIEGDESGMLPFPKSLLSLPITDLHIRHFRIFEVAGLHSLRKLDFASHFIQEDILPVCKHFARLTSLIIWGYHPKRALVLPPEIGNLKDLEELELVTCAMDSLPEELSQLVKLKRVLLRNHNFKEFPLALTKISNLETLEFSHSPLVTSLPDEMKTMKNLKNLDLHYNFKGKIQTLDEELDEMFEELDGDTPKPGFQVPAVIGELHQLETLNLGHCEVGDIESVVRLSQLKKLTLHSAKLQSVEALAIMSNLEELDLSSVTRLRTISPLVQLRRLKKLNLSSCDLRDLSPLLQMTALEELNIEQCLYLKDVSPVINHPTLKTLHANDTIIQQWEQRALAASLPSKDKILESLTSDDLKKVEDGIQQLATYVRLNSGDVSALFKFFDLDSNDYDETEIVEIEVLSKLIGTYGVMLSSQSVVSLVSIGLNRNIYDNFQVTLDAIKLLVDRKDVAGQKQVVEIFKNACEYYDAGHRFWEDTVQDQLLDSLFPEFEGDALAELLIWCNSDYLMNDMGLDGMDGLFKPAFERVQDRELERKLLDKFVEYIGELDADYVQSSGILDDYDNASTTVKEAIEKLKTSVGASDDGEEEEEEGKDGEVYDEDEEDEVDVSDDEEDDDDDDEDELDDNAEQHFLSYKDDQSDDFWFVTISGSSFIVRYERTTQFDDHIECRKEADRLIGENVKKGYQDNGHPMNGVNEYYLTYRDGQSDELWHMTNTPNSFTVTSEKTVRFSNEDDCRNEANKLIQQKLQEGYHLDENEDDEEEDVDAANQSFELSEEFFEYVKSASAKIEDPEVKEKLKSADWQEYADLAYADVLNHWKALSPKSEGNRIGSFIIGWNDGENNGIDIDFVDGNDDDAYSDGATKEFASNVICFDYFFNSEFDLSPVEELEDEDYFDEIKNILCRMVQEVVIASTSSREFLEINTEDYHRIWFYYWHDEDLIEIYNNADGSLLSDLEKGTEDEDDQSDQEKTLVDEFTEACEDEDIETIVALIQRFPEMKGKAEMEPLVALFYNRHNEWLKSGDFDNAKQILKAYHDIIPIVGHSDRIAYGNETGTAMHMRQSIASDAVVLAALSNDPEVFALAKTFIPDHITDAVLAYNLACYTAIIRDKEQMLKYTRLAINLGKQKKQFMAESDFDFYKNDKDFLEALG